MNRDDLLKRCVDRRVAHETSVVAVSHLFYVYLLSALKKGQRVEVPNFGTFGTNIVGVKRQRRMPFFEVENDLADKVNERYRDLKTLLVGKYELTPAEDEAEYAGKMPPHDSLVETAGKEVVLDTYRDVSPEQFHQQVSQVETVFPPVAHPVVHVPPVSSRHREEPAHEFEQAPPSKEKKLMPKLNLRGEEMEGEQTPAPPPGPETELTMLPVPPPTLRDISGGGGPSPTLQIMLVLIILAAITFALNHFGIIHFWGSKTPTQSTEESLPPIVQPPPQADQESLDQQQVEPTPTPVKPSEVSPTTSEKQSEKEKEPAATQQPPTTTGGISTSPPAGAGNYTVQISSWTRRSDANRVVTRLSKSGFDAYVIEAFAKGRTWFRVRAGRFETPEAAKTATDRLKIVNENGVWVTKIDP